MFVLFGLKTRQKVADRGTFHCPNEDAARPYQHVRARRWFTLFFIPVLPLDRQGEHVRCQSCGATYAPDVLRRHPARA